MFDLIHCDSWTSPVPSVFGYQYYLVILDDFSHFLWTFPLRLKSNTFTTIAHFFLMWLPILASALRPYNATMVVSSITPAPVPSFLLVAPIFACRAHLTRGAHQRIKNGKAEHIIRSTNNIIRSLLFQAGLPSAYWAEALHTATLTEHLAYQDPSVLHAALHSLRHHAEL